MYIYGGHRCDGKMHCGDFSDEDTANGKCEGKKHVRLFQVQMAYFGKSKKLVITTC